ncbi:Hypothetical predicted protein [Cloeon dipterum]|uniref:Cap-specific mRNA (nucleoside-2'-O-)-methyltransferase 1 n=1 Tax=Cloeon dipterum TaxID=197152 RepID=A0A8S1DLI7_9INSE|nr:Hypothetical predicted protein [Cloeon dipterum]
MDDKKPGHTPNRKRLIDVGNEDSDTKEISTSTAASSKAMKMMDSMGYIPGKGLGQGTRIAFASEEVEVAERKVWLSKCASATLLSVDDWIELGQRQLSMENEHTFCDPQVLKAVLDSKSALDVLDKSLIRRARDKSNPFVTIGKAFFQNRAALKMANIDAACDFMFTSPRDRQGVARECDPLFFADVYAGPGGFSEYVLWRKGKASVESFEPCYGQAGDGDVYKGVNILHFRDYVKANTGGKGVHFTMADGGFSVEGRENNQELLSHWLYLCQCLLALTITRPGGHFVVKLFDIFT